MDRTMQVTEKGEAYIRGYNQALKDISEYGHYTPNQLRKWALVSIDILGFNPEKGLVPFLRHVADTLEGE